MTTRKEAGPDPLAGVDFYVGLRAIFGTHLNHGELIESLARSSWMESFVAVSHLAAMTANAPEGVRSARVRDASLQPLLRANAEGPIAQVQEYLRANYDRVNIAHEEALSFVQHLIILHGGDTDREPSEYERSMWLLAAGDHVAEWAEADGRTLSATELLIAEAAKASRSNRTTDPLRDVARIYLMFRDAPAVGRFSDSERWKELQQAALGVSYETYFQTRIFPLFMASKGWGTGTTKVSEVPVIQVSSWSEAVGSEEAEQVAKWLGELSVDRATLRAEIRKRMRLEDQLPHAPTALLHHPLVKLKDDFIGVASPWMMRAHLVTGVWAAFLRAVKAMADGLEWMRSFGYVFEGWLRRVAKMVPPSEQIKFVLADTIGGEDEVEDVVALESGHAILFSAKSRMVKEEIARHAVSRSKVVDWYEEFFFSKKAGDQRGGAVRQIDARISMLRKGVFEKYGVPRTEHVIPVLVTFDDLCEERELYEWLEARCLAEGLLQQQNVSPLVLANVDEFERLMAIPRRGESLAAFLRERETKSRHLRLNMQFRSTREQDRFPEMVAAFESVWEPLKRRAESLEQSSSVET